MPVSLARRSLWAVGIVVVLTILTVIALPLIASTQIVRDGIAYQLSAWSGYRVRLEETPNLRVWPTFQAVLNDVSLSEWGNGDPVPVLEAERVEVDLSALAALQGEIVFTKIRLIRPVLRLRGRAEHPNLPPPQNWGRMARSIASARDIVSAAPTDPNTDALPTDSFGEIEFDDARIIRRTGDRHVDIVTSLTGEFEWPALNRQARLSANGIWRGETVNLEVTSEQPLLLLGGGSTPVRLSLQAPPANASFQGAVNLSGDNYFDGRLTFSAPSLNRLAEWTHGTFLPGDSIGPVSVDARVTGGMRRLQLSETTLGLGSSTGKGLLEVGLGTSSRPSIAGTLAFDTLDMRALANAFSPLAPEPSPIPPATPPMAASGYDFDLRLSAVNAPFGSAALTNLAATVKVKDGLSSFDISDATAFGGTIQLGLRADRSGPKQLVELRMAGENIDTGKLFATLGMQKLVPQARSTFSTVLKAAGSSGAELANSLGGSFSATIGAGNVPGLSVEGLLERSIEGDFFPLEALQDGTLAINSAEMKASIANGVAEIEKAEALSGQHRISVNGLVPLAGRSLALYGTVRAADGAPSSTEPANPLTFFVGGSWDAPFIASFLPPATGSDAR
ncbi:AsmA-like C-terminal region-containing protein [Chelativorans sp. M5D2P16]|uniref:AsmA family protein n=1 Tax=Chelativorans sp. M5D2P16 TaxID=3095678 RepID=UPI002ACAACEF|nr:AsmA-like C-terminal region-containing protein [Chelativorans sp. M5D2P16]MDZ5699597.1 AsmA-like C-terminal region-containing protein [Chelativorans sp. M5D2P16]